MIILEGPDKAGKTTLANLIVSTFEKEYPHLATPKYFHFGVPTAGTCHVEELKVELERQPYYTVFDRGGLSAFAYDYKSPGDPSRIMTTVKMLDDAVQHMARHMALLIYVTADDESLAERLRIEGDSNNYVDERELLFTKHLYDVLFDRYFNSPIGQSPHILTLNTSAYSSEQFVNDGLNMLRTFLYGYTSSGALE